MALIKYFMAVHAYLFVLAMSRLKKKKSNEEVPLIIVSALI